ncbi:MAG TPA: hypothetical protein VGM65_12125 [Candidatus Udaeobacter sp.]
MSSPLRGFVYVARLPAGSIPAPAFPTTLGFVGQRGFVPRAGSIDSLAPASSPLRGFVYVARLPPAPFPPPAFFVICALSEMRGEPLLERAIGNTGEKYTTAQPRGLRLAAGTALISAP